MQDEQLLLSHVASFVESDGAVIYAAACREFGVDPAEGIDDPWLAVQLRVGLFASLRASEKQQTDKAKKEKGSDALFDEHKSRMAEAKRKLTGK